MTITQLDPADSVAMGEWYDLMVAVTRHDLPDFPTPRRQEHMARFEHPLPGVTEEALLAWDGDRVAGAASYQLPQSSTCRIAAPISAGLALLQMKPAAPWSSTRRTTCGSSCADTTSTATAGCCPRTAASPVRPWLPGMCRSSSTRSMSGSPRSAASAVARSVASRTLQPGRLYSAAWRNAARNSGWSSAISKLGMTARLPERLPASSCEPSRWTFVRW